MKKVLIALASVLIYGVTSFGAVAVAGPVQLPQASLIKVQDDAPKKGKKADKKKTEKKTEKKAAKKAKKDED